MGSQNQDISVLPYWQANIREDQRSNECPEFLRNISEKDQGILSTPDELYQRDTWEQAKKKVADNHIHLFQRMPSELRRYRAFTWQLRQDYGSIVNYILTHRLHWPYPIAARGKPFEFDDDIKILWNDWPYGIDTRIVHLVVWTKFDIEEDPVTGDLTNEARAEIDNFVRKTFAEMAQDRVGNAGSRHDGAQ